MVRVMEHIAKRLTCLLLAMVMVIGLLSGVTASAVETSASIYDLRVNDQRNPIGVDDAKPTFSWKMKSDAIGAAQTAYAITVSDGTKTLWDTGWVTGSDSIGIVYAGAALAASTEYTVCVSVQDQNGAILTTEGTFETGLMGKLGSAKWISLKNDSNYISTTTTYTIDFDFTLESGNQGFAFSMKDKSNYVMWQLNTVKGKNVLLRPHFKINGKWNAPVDVNVTSALGYNSANLIGKTVHQRIVVSGSVIKTYFGPNAQNLTLAHTFDCKKYSATSSITTIPLYNLGFRHNTSTSGGTEICSFDNIVVTNSSGKTLYTQDFSGHYVLNAINGGYALKNGALKGGSATKGEYVAALKSNSVNSLPAFRRSFQTKNVASAKLYTSGLGVYESYINGQRVGRLLEDGSIEYHELKPGFTEMGERKFYNAYDVTWMLRDNGENVLSSMVSGGWWSGEIGAYYGTEDAYWATLILKYTDGSTETIVTDTNWRAAKESPLQKGTGIFEGERYNAAISTAWMLPGYDASLWSKAKVNTEFTGKLVAWDGEFVTARKDLERVPAEMYVYKGVSNDSTDYYGTVNVLRTYEDGDTITLNRGETLVVDFGQNFAGWEAFTVTGAAGTRIHVEHGEMLNDGNGATFRGCDGPEGSVYNKNYRTATADTYYTLSGNGPESYHPTHTYYGFRYASFTTNKTVTLTGIRGQVVTSVKEDTAWITTSDKDVNKLVSNIRWGMYSNYLSIPTDCPQRSERMGWTGDAQNFAEAGAYLGNNKSFLEKYLVDLRDTQKSDGRYAGTAPTGSYGGATFGALGWADAGIIIPYYLYVIYGDTTTIAEHWNSMTLYMDTYMASTNGMGGAHNYGDHVSYESNDTEIKNMLGVSYYAWDALLMSEMAAALGKTSDAARYLKLYEKEKALYQSLYVLKDGSLKRDVQTVCLYALYLDLLPNQKSVDKVTAQLIANIERNGNKLQTGFLGTEIIMHTLTKIGRSDVAYKLLLQHNCPSWLYTVDQGATTMWESWNAYTPYRGLATSRNSFNHYSFGAVASWMIRGMAGISFDTENPGFKHIILSPQPNQLLKSVDATYESVYGPINSAIKYEGDTLNYTFSIPANTTATLYLPVERIDTLTVDGGTVEAAGGMTFVGYSHGIAQFEASSGTHTLSSKLEPKRFVTLNVEHDVHVPIARTRVYCNDQLVATQLPATLEVQDGDVLTATVTPKNAIDYAVTGWNIGDEVVESNFLHHVVNGSATITAVVDYVGYDNLAVGASVNTEQHNTSWSSAFLTDGILNTLGGSRGWSSSSRATDTLSFSVFYTTIDLGKRMTFNRFQMYPRDYDVTALEGFPVAYTIYVSNNRTDWTAVYTTSNGELPVNIYSPATIQLNKNVTGRYVRLGVTKVNKLDVGNRAFVQLNEFGVYCVDDLVEKRTVTVKVKAPASVPIEGAEICVNGKIIPSELPAEVFVRPGDMVSISVKPMNAVDYAVINWSFSDGSTVEGDILHFVAQDSVTVTANVGYAGYENLAEGASVDTKQHNTGWSSTYLTDGILNTLGGSRGWSSSSRGADKLSFAEFFAVIDLGEKMAFNRFQMYPRDYQVTELEGFPVAYTIYISDNKTDWTPVYTTNNGELPRNLYSPVTIQMNKDVEGRYVRLGVTKVNKLDVANRAFVQLNEFGVYCAEDRFATGAVAVKINVPASMPVTDAEVRINGTVVSNLLPTEVLAMPGDEIMVSAKPMNDVDYAVTGWTISGSGTVEGTTLNFVAEDSVTVTANIDYIGYENLALGASVTAEERSANWCGAFLTDGILNTRDTNKSWSSALRATDNMAFREHFATIDLGQKTEFNRIQMYPRDSGITVPVGFPLAYTIYVSNDNTNWYPVYTTRAGDTPDNLYRPAVVQLPYTVNARYIRLGVTRVSYLDVKNRAFVQLNELGVYMVSDFLPVE